MKKLLLWLALLMPLAASAANEYYCDCNTGAAGGCTAGSDANDGSTPALAKQLFSTYITRWKTAAAGTQFLFCQGGSWNSATQTVASGGNLNNANATAANPVITGSYDASSVWSGGAGIKPKWINAATTRVLDMNQGTISSARNGYIFQDIEIDGGGTNTTAMVSIAGSTNYVTLQRMFIHNSAGTGVQCNGAATSFPSGGASLSLSKYFTLRDSTISDNSGQGILNTCDYALIEGNTFDHNSSGGGTHHIYLSGTHKVLATPTLSAISGDGTTITVTCSADCGLSPTIKQSLSITGVTGGTGTATVTNHMVDYVDSTHFSISSMGAWSSSITYAAGQSVDSGGVTYVAIATTTNNVPPNASFWTTLLNGTGSGGTITANSVRQTLIHDQIDVRNNTLTNLNVGAAGSCTDVAIVAHGIINHLNIENNSVSEPTVTTNGACWGISVDAGYSNYANAPRGQEGFGKVVIRGNTVLNYGTGIGLDLCASCIVENNYVRSTYNGSGRRGIALRSKAGAITENSTEPTGVTMRYNSVHLTKPGSDGIGIALKADSGDPLAGTGHAVYGNVVVMGGDADPTSAAKCFDTSNLTRLTQFARFDRNFCYYFNVAPAWDNTSSLATIQAGGDASRSDLNSTFAATTDVTSGQPFWTAPTTSPAISTSSALMGAGYSTTALKPYSAWGGIKRTKSTADAGASEQGATTVIPNAQTRIAVQ